MFKLNGIVNYLSGLLNEPQQISYNAEYAKIDKEFWEKAKVIDLENCSEQVNKNLTWKLNKQLEILCGILKIKE